MARFCGVWGAILLLAGINAAAAQDSLKIITYNLQGMKPGTDPQERLFHTIQYLKILNPDIIGLQEINETLTGGGVDNQARVIADSLGAYFGVTYHYYISYTHLSWNNQFKEYIGIISKHPVEQSGFQQLVPGVFPRKVVWNHINTPLGKINFFNTHLDFNSTATRVQQVQQVMGYVDQTENAVPALASVLTGDFNDTPGSQPILLLTATGTDTFFIDTYYAANPALPGYTVPAQAPSSRIDYIFYKNTGQLMIDTSRVIMNQPYNGTNYCSDHLGVMTLFSAGGSGTGSGGSPVAPGGFELYQNYPNPFNPATTIPYYLPRRGEVALRIYNSVGRNIRTLVYEIQSAGFKTAIWDGKDDTSSAVASGIYFYQLKTGEFTQTRKLLLLK